MTEPDKNWLEREPLTAREQAEVDAFKKAAERFVKEATKDKQTAIDTLVEMGICTPDGMLTENYRS